MRDIPTTEALRSAAEQRARALASRDPLFSPWAEATLGEPLLVRTVAGRPSYWLVPVEHESRTIGFVRVTQAGKAVAAGALYRDPADLESAPHTVTGITAAEAVERIADAVGPGGVVSGPMYVHDGPPGREAWMVRVRNSDGGGRTIFVTAGGWYERSASEASDPSLEG